MFDVTGQFQMAYRLFEYAALAAVLFCVTGCGWGDRYEKVEMRRSSDRSIANCSDFYAVSLGLSALLTDNDTSPKIARCVAACKRLGFEVVSSPAPKISRPPTAPEAADIKDAECEIAGKQPNQPG